MGGVDEGRACCGGRRKEDGGGGDYFSWVSYSRGQISNHSGRRGREGGGWLEEEWEGLVQMDCLQRAAAPLACFTSPVSAALILPLTGENRGERGEEDRAVDADKHSLVELSIPYLKNKEITAL